MVKHNSQLHLRASVGRIYDSNDPLSIWPTRWST